MYLKRLIAYILDVVFFYLVLLVFVDHFAYENEALVESSTNFAILMFYLYQTVSIWRYGQGVGGRIMKIIVVGEKGEQITFFRSLLRALILVSIGHILWIFCFIKPYKERGQTIWDYGSKTTVLEEE